MNYVSTLLASDLLDTTFLWLKRVSSLIGSDTLISNVAYNTVDETDFPVTVTETV